MYTIKKLFKLSNIGTLIFCLLNLVLILFVFTGGFSDVSIVPGLIVLYLLTLIISLSPLGELIFALLIGAKKMKRRDMKLKMIPLLQIAFDKAKIKEPKMVNSIHLMLIEDPYPNAYSVGRRTICVTNGLFDLPDDAIIGIFAHELGHVANRHSEIQLLIGGANVFITVALFILKIVAWIIRIIISIFAIRAKSTVGTILLFIASLFSTWAISIWSKFCILFLKASLRSNEYVADKFAYDIGFGRELASALTILQSIDVLPKGILNVLYSSHPTVNDRIYRLQLLGLNYSQW